MGERASGKSSPDPWCIKKELVRGAERSLRVESCERMSKKFQDGKDKLGLGRKLLNQTQAT